ncbi:unnamed protein product [Absidia cylindrospora]
MFGSIAATTPSNKTSKENTVDSRPPSNPSDPTDPWNDSSLLQFWQQAIESYKVHHNSTPETKVSNDPLVERTKRLESTMQDDQTENRKRTKLDHGNRSTTRATKTSTKNVTFTAPSSSIENSVEQTNSKQQANDNNDLERVDEINQQNYLVDVDSDKENKNNEEGHQEYDYDQDPDKENQENEDYQAYHDYYNGYGYDYEQYPQYDQSYQDQHQDQHQHQPQPQSAPVPPPPTMFGQQGSGNEAFTNMIMAWYYSGYYTGLYQVNIKRLLCI